jgi:hypothetical protein
VYLRTTKEWKDRQHKRMGFPAEMEMVKNWTISLEPLQQHHPREKGKAVDELAELGAAHSLTSTQRQIVKDAMIEVSTNGDEFATQVYDLLQAVIDDEFRTHKPEGQHGLAISENSKLYRDDVYSLYCVTEKRARRGTRMQSSIPCLTLKPHTSPTCMLSATLCGGFKQRCEFPQRNRMGAAQRWSQASFGR